MPRPGDIAVSKRGAWAAQSVKRQTLGFSLGRDLSVCGFEPRIGLCTDSAEPTWGSLSPPAPPLPSLHCVLSVSLKINK